MGNQSIQGYKNISDQFFMGGTGKQWRISKAFKEQTKKEGSVFLVEKKKLKIKKGKKENTEIFNQNLDILKKEGTN